MNDGKVAMPASGQGSPKIHSDGVGNVDTHGRGRGGESGGGRYVDPYAGKGAPGERGGGQSVRGYYGPGQLNGEKADPAQPGAVGQGGDAETADAAPHHRPHRVTAEGQTFDVVQAGGVAEAEVAGKIGTDAGYEAEQESPGSGSGQRDAYLVPLAAHQASCCRGGRVAPLRISDRPSRARARL